MVNNTTSETTNEILKVILFADDPLWFNASDNNNWEHKSSTWWTSYADCPLLNFDTQTDKIRLVFELIQLTGAFLYIVAALRESKFLGYKMFIENLVRSFIESIDRL